MTFEVASCMSSQKQRIDTIIHTEKHKLSTVGIRKESVAYLVFLEGLFHLVERETGKRRQKDGE